MGGMGSGRFGRRGGRRRVEETGSIDVVAVLHDGVPTGPTAAYSIGIREGDASEFAIRETRVALVSAPQPFGGRRWWLVCNHCGARRQRLYVSSAWGQPTKRLACRVCLRLAYRSQQSGPLQRAEFMAHKLWGRAAGVAPDELPSGYVPKPPKKHWRTFDKDFDRGQRHMDRVNRAIMVALGRALRFR